MRERLAYNVVGCLAKSLTDSRLYETRRPDPRKSELEPRDGIDRHEPHLVPLRPRLATDASSESNQVPPLRDRRGDIEPLAKYFLSIHARHYRKPIDGLEEGAARALRDYPWPGNIRELDHAVERAVLMAQGERVKVGDLGLRPVSDNGASSIEDLNLEEVERLLIQKALARYNGNVSHAAKALGLSRSALYRRLERYRL